MDADDLYRLPPEDFTAARDAAVKERKAAGDKDAAAELKSLRRPSVAAWLVNTLAREDSDLLDQLLALGPALAQAQAQGHGDELRELGAQRRDLVAAVTDRAVELGERSVSAAVREEVQSTLEAALADPPSAEAVRSGRLVRALSYAGFGGVDLDGAVAVTARTSATPTSARKAKRAAVPPEDDRAERIAAAEAAALDAAGALDDAVRACERAQQERDAAAGRADEAREELERLREAARAAEVAVRDADAARRAADKDSERAVRLVERRQAQEQEARGALDRLRRGKA